MARLSTKRAMLNPQMIVPDQGVNYGKAPVDLALTELANSLNGYYPKQSNRWTVRPGFEAATSAVNALSSPILKLMPYYNGTTLYLICASGGKLYYMTKATLDGTPAWTEIGSLTDSTTKPSMVVYNGLLVVADGGTDVRYWDGTTYGNLTNSPSGCTALAEARGRLIGNSSASVDYVYLSAANFSDKDWKSGAGQYEIAAGWGDGLSVNGFAVGPGGQDVIVSKYDAGQGVAQLRRLLMADADPGNWYVSDPSDGNTGAQNPHSIWAAFGSTYYFDDVGIKKISATDTYAEIVPDPHFGKRLNKLFTTFNAVGQEIAYLPTIGALLILLRSHPQQYLYFPRNDAFCPWRMSGVIVNSVCTIDGVIYWGDSNGNLYKMTEDINTDEVTPGGTTVAIQSYGRSKKIVANGRDMALRRTTLALTPIKSGTMAVHAIRNDEVQKNQIGQDFEIEDGTNLLGLATGLLGEATTLLGASGAEPTQKILRGGPRSKGLQVEWQGNGARYELEFITVEINGPLGA